MALKPATPRGRTQRQKAIRKTLDSIHEQVSDAEAVDRIKDVILMATPAEYDAGIGWYGVGNESAAQVAHETGLATTAGAGIIAALSPQKAWVENVANAFELVTGQVVTAQLPLSLERANAIIGGEAPFDVLGGQKVRSFWYNLSHPGRPGAITVDRHAINLIFAESSEKNIKLLERIGAYHWVAAVYRTVGRDLDILPQQAQAISWLVWRRLEDDRGARSAWLRRNEYER